MITVICKPKTLTKHISYNCECTFNCRKYKFNQKSNNDKCLCECKHGVREKIIFKIFTALQIKLQTRQYSFQPKGLQQNLLQQISAFSYPSY